MIKICVFFLLLISCQTNKSNVEYSSPASSHIGEWETSCYSNGNGTYGSINLLITGDTLELTTGVFFDSGCTIVIGEFYLKSNTYSRTQNNYSTTLDLYQFTPLNSDYASTLNVNSYCGASPNWQNGETQSLFDRTCLGNDPILVNTSYQFTIEAIRIGDTLDTDYSEEIFYKME
jgi:hypothetical protein